MGLGFSGNQNNVVNKKMFFKKEIEVAGVTQGLAKTYTADGAISPKLSFANCTTSGSQLDMTLGAGAIGQRMLVANLVTDTFDVVVKDAATNTILTLTDGQVKELVCLGSTWVLVV